jgi:hypothetical protein
MRRIAEALELAPGHAYQDVDGIITSDFQFESPPASGNDDARIVVL